MSSMNDSTKIRNNIFETIGLDMTVSIIRRIVGSGIFQALVCKHFVEALRVSTLKNTPAIETSLNLGNLFIKTNNTNSLQIILSCLTDHDYKIFKNERVETQDFLVTACLYDYHGDCLKILIKHGMMHVKGLDTTTLVMKALSTNNHNCLQILLDNNASIVQQKFAISNPLVYATSRGLDVCVKKLLNAKANLHGNYDNNNGPLHYMQQATKAITARGSTEPYLKQTLQTIINDLVSAKADINQLNSCGKCPLKCSIDLVEVTPSPLDTGFTSYAHPVRFTGVDSIVSTQQSVRVKGIKSIIVDLLIRAKANINAPVDQHSHNSITSPLIHALHKNNSEAATVLIKAGADLNYFYKPDFFKPNKHGIKTSMSALETTIDYRNIKMMKLLISHCANIEQINQHSGKTPLIKALGLPDMVLANILINSGANIYASVNGFDVRSIAAAKGYSDIVDFIDLKRALNVNETVQLESDPYSVAYSDY